MAGEELQNALGGLNFAPAENPWGMGAMALGQATPGMISPYASTGQALGIGLGSILLQSLLGYQARQSALQDSLETNTLANQMLKMQTPEERTSFMGGLDVSPQIGSRLSALSTALTQQDALRQSAIAAKVAEKEALAKYELGDLGKQMADEEIRREVAKNVQRSLLLRNALTGTTATTDGVGADVFGALPPLEGATPLQEKRDALIARGKAMKMTPNQAANYAEKVLAVETQATKGTQKKLEASRERASKLEQVASTALAGVEGAGETGGALGPIREKLSSLYAVVNPAEQEQRDYQKILDSVRPQVVNMLKSPGAVSDFETKLLMGAGPSSTNTQSENRRLIQGMQVISGLENDYADFVENFISKQGTSVGADALWRQYKDEQVFPAGQYNPQRVDWRSWMADRGLDEGATTGLATTPNADAKLAKLRQLQQMLAELKAQKGR